MKGKKYGKEWERLTNIDKERRESYIVGLANVQEYEKDKWQFAEDENGNIDSDIYEIAKEYK